MASVQDLIESEKIVPGQKPSPLAGLIGSESTRYQMRNYPLANLGFDSEKVHGNPKVVMPTTFGFYVPPGFNDVEDRDYNQAQQAQKLGYAGFANMPANDFIVLSKEAIPQTGQKFSWRTLIHESTHRGYAKVRGELGNEAVPFVKIDGQFLTEESMVRIMDALSGFVTNPRGQNDLYSYFKNVHEMEPDQVDAMLIHPEVLKAIMRLNKRADELAGDDKSFQTHQSDESLKQNIGGELMTVLSPVYLAETGQGTRRFAVDE